MAVISVEHVSKRYRKGQVSYHTLREDVYELTGRLFRPTRKDDEGHIWALKDVSFEVNQGERLGIIGANGSGKTTLLRLLAKVTKPTSGRISIRGRMGVLIEIMAGFHPDLTGRENVYLNGAIMGMSQKEIRRKFDEIVAFAELEEWIDTPIKRYSSGMNVRLGFAVAAHLDPEILLVDEVLAVGDASFQRKCLRKMDSAAAEGRTVILVSHSMGAVSTLTTRSILLDKGSMAFDGETSDAILRYAAPVNAGRFAAEPVWQAKCRTTHPIQINCVRLLALDGSVASSFDVEQGLSVQVEYEVRTPISGAVVSINVHASDGAHVVSLEDTDQDRDALLGRQPGFYCATVMGGSFAVCEFENRR